MAERSSSASPRTRRRRGQQRVESLLAAAERVFAETGYEAATTNRIAAQASASPGSLYQFFRDKEQMAEAIATRYAAQLSALHDRLLEIGGHDTADKAIDSVVDLYVKFLRMAPAFGALFVSASISRNISTRASILNDTVAARLARLMQEFAPHLSSSALHLHAEICCLIFRSMIPLLQSDNARRRRQAAEQYRLVVKRYLRPILTSKIGAGER